MFTKINNTEWIKMKKRNTVKNLTKVLLFCTVILLCVFGISAWASKPETATVTVEQLIEANDRQKVIEEYGTCTLRKPPRTSQAQFIRQMRYILRWCTAYQSRSVTEQALPWVLSCFRSYSSLFSDSARPNTDLLIKEKANNGKGYYPPTFLRRWVIRKKFER